MHVNYSTGKISFVFSNLTQNAKGRKILQKISCQVLRKYVQLTSSCYVWTDGEIKLAQIRNTFFIFVDIKLKLLQAANFQYSM
jgi:hypothetical protein